MTSISQGSWRTPTLLLVVSFALSAIWDPSPKNATEEEAAVESIRFGGASLSVKHEIIRFEPGLGEELKKIAPGDRIRHEILQLKDRFGVTLESDVPFTIGEETLKAGQYRCFPWVLPTGGIEIVMLKGRSRYAFTAKCVRTSLAADHLSCELLATGRDRVLFRLRWGRDVASLMIDPGE